VQLRDEATNVLVNPEFGLRDTEVPSEFRIWNSVFRILCLLLLPVTSTAQTPYPVERTTPAPVLTWWKGAAVLSGVLTSALFDEVVQEETQETRTPAKDQAAAIFRHMGQPEVFATIPITLYLGGLIGHDVALRTAGTRIAASLATAAVFSTSLKYSVGRERPDAVTEPNVFRPFSGADAFPSGHTTMAFALATALSDEIHRPWASLGLFAFATGTGWSRLNDNKHWLSDVVAGSAIGIMSAQVVERRWRLRGAVGPGRIAFQVGQ
jgi:membrane-associated phospholipid phosphatase